jgi:hypothetical protein
MTYYLAVLIAVTGAVVMPIIIGSSASFMILNYLVPDLLAAVLSGIIGLFAGFIGLCLLFAWLSD